MGRRNVAEGAERPLKKSDRLPVTRGGQKVEYFFKYPNASGSWRPKE